MHQSSPHPEQGRDNSQGVSIVVPTYREAENLPALAARISDAMGGTSFTWEMIVVDDESRDGSEAVVAELAQRFPVRIRTRLESPRDLSLSVLLGIRLARFDRVVVLDADLSHPPERIPDLLGELGPGCDMAIGSRYAPGGGVDSAWGMWNLLNSRLATALARPLTNCLDPMSGFFAVRRGNLPDPESLDPIGYKIGLELMVRGQLRVAEVPIDFAQRGKGASKTNWRQRVNFLRHLGRLYGFRYGSVSRAIRFGLVGLSGVAVDTAFYIGLQMLGLEHRLARFLAFWPAVTWNWFLNRSFTFRDRPRQPRVRQWVKFVTSSLLGLAANVGTYLALTSHVDILDRYRLVAFACGIAVGSVFNFLAATAYVYRKHSESTPER